MTYHAKSDESWFERKKRERGERAVVRQLDYQRKKSEELTQDPRMTILNIKRKALVVREKIEKFRQTKPDDKVLEVGSGAHGLIFGFDEQFAVGIDPLASSYRELFPIWQKETNTVTGVGEELPFPDNSFDVVLSDNVIDHAADPVKIIHELIRVLNPEGILYFTVNTHHPVYQPVSVIHGIWNAFGLNFEITPFADHTIHFTESSIQHAFENLPLKVLSKGTPHKGKVPAGNGFENKLKKVFPKNTLFELIALKSQS